MKATHMVAFALLVIGGLNWLLVGLFTWGIGNLFGDMTAPISIIPRIIYILVGLSAIYIAATHKSACKMCMTKSAGM